MTAPICTVCGTAGCGGGGTCPGPVVISSGSRENETEKHR